LPEPLSLNLPAPDFSLCDLHGNNHSLHDYYGQVVVINFWSAECPWSTRADNALSQALSGQNDIVILTIAANINETPSQIEQAAKERNLSVVLIDEDCKVADIYHAVTTPHLFIVDQNGILQYQGAFDDVTFRQRVPNYSYVLDALDAIKKGLPPEPSQTQPYGCTIIRYLV
jgi:peroxiredoxin